MEIDPYLFKVREYPKWKITPHVCYLFFCLCTYSMKIYYCYSSHTGSDRSLSRTPNIWVLWYRLWCLNPSTVRVPLFLSVFYEGSVHTSSSRDVLSTTYFTRCNNCYEGFRLLHFCFRIFLLIIKSLNFLIRSWV